MNTDGIFPALDITALWERDLVSREGDDTALVIRIRAAQRPPARAKRAPIDIAFALDRSGSMAGRDKIDLVKDAVVAATHHLSAEDRVALVVFDNVVDVLHELSEATDFGKRRLEHVLEGVMARGGTNLSGGWLTACQQLASTPESMAAPRLQRSLLLTDGLANQGITAPDELMTHALELRRRGIDTTTIGVGLHFDEFLLGGMAEAGGGAFQYIADTSELFAFFEKEIGGLIDAVASRPRLSITFPDGVRGWLVNAFPVDREGKTITVDLRDLASGDEVSLVFDVSVRPGARSKDLVPMIALEWQQPGSRERSGLHREAPALRLTDPAEARHAPRNDDAAEAVAMERSARDHREAIRLDREGRFRESRRRFQESADRLAQAPETIAVREERAVSMRMASMVEAPLDEHTRKQRVFETQRRSRGGRRP
jgi:Ca-activated chloride channel family protein